MKWKWKQKQKQKQKQAGSAEDGAGEGSRDATERIKGGSSWQTDKKGKKRRMAAHSSDADR